jgi:hypothetical protein
MNKYFEDLLERTYIWFNNLTDEEWRDWNYFIAVTCGILIIMTWSIRRIRRRRTTRRRKRNITRII